MPRFFSSFMKAPATKPLFQGGPRPLALAMVLPLGLSAGSMGGEIGSRLDIGRVANPAASGGLPDSPAALLLTRWIEAHNSGNRERVRQFILSHYQPDLLRKVRIEDHVAFYMDGIAEFGRLDLRHAVIKKDSPHSLRIQLLRLDIPDQEKMKPQNIMVVDVDVAPEDPTHLKRAIGFGSLACALRETRR